MAHKNPRNFTLSWPHEEDTARATFTFLGREKKLIGEFIISLSLFHFCQAQTCPFCNSNALVLNNPQQRQCVSHSPLISHADVRKTVPSYGKAPNNEKSFCEIIIHVYNNNLLFTLLKKKVAEFE